MNYIEDENLSDDLTNEHVSPLSVKTLPTLDRNMKSNPLRAHKKLQKTPIWDKICKEAFYSDWFDDLSDLDQLWDQTPNIANLSMKNRQRSRSLVDNELEQEWKDWKSDKKSLKGDIKMLLQKAIKIRKNSDSESAFVNPSKLLGSTSETSKNIFVDESEIMLADKNIPKEKSCMEEGRIVTMNDLTPSFNNF